MPHLAPRALPAALRPVPPFATAALRRACARAGAATLVALFVCAAATPARAYERQWHAGVHGGYASYAVDAEGHGGIGGGVHLAYGLSDAFNALLEIDVSRHRLAAERPATVVTDVSLGAAYTLDVLRWVPYAGLMVGAYPVFGGGEGADVRLGVSLPVGLDYHLSRGFALGAQARLHALVADLGDNFYTTLMLRADYVWGY